MVSVISFISTVMSFGKACASFTSYTCVLAGARQFVSSFPSTFQRDVTKVQLLLIENKRENFVKRETNDQPTDLNPPAEIKHLDRDVADNRHCMLSVALQLYVSSPKHSVLSNSSHLRNLSHSIKQRQ